ncbi:MAG TPA: hypothetical protein PLK29_06155 [Chiayiivirga sp.]|nr:hypothetical protein [Chiayiivirga sp.]
MKRWLALALVVAAFGWWTSPPMGRSRPPGVLAPQVPVQEDLKDAPVIERGEFRLTPLAHFRVNARVLGREDYRFDEGAALSPMDLALGWGRMSDSAVLDRLDIDQSMRFYSWRWRNEPPLPPQEIVESSANMHLIPADAGVERQLRRVRRGDVVEIEGYLIEARRDDGWFWRSSLTRKDSGAGACELVYVTSVSRS